VTLRGNSFVGNELYALQNLTRITVDAQDNWWGPEEPQAAVSGRPLLPWFFPLPSVLSPLSLRVSPTFVGLDEGTLSLGGLGVSGESFAVLPWVKIIIDRRDLWEWRAVFLPGTITLSVSLLMVPLENGNWLAQPADHEGER